MKLTKNRELRINFRTDPENKRWPQCNFKCAYCTSTNLNVIQAPLNENHYQQAVYIWDKLATVEDEILVRVNLQGESLFDKVAKKCLFYINKIPNVKLFEIITNNSINPETYLHELDLTKTSFNCSFHPEFIPLKKFIKHLLIIKNNGCNVFANVVTTPQIIRKLPKLYSTFNKYDIHLKLTGLQTWGFQYNGKNYPWDFDAKQRRILKQYFDSIEEYEFMVELKRTKGLDCYAGVDMINVFLDGSIRRCFNGEIGQIDDLISGKIKLKNDPYPCSFEICPCYADFIGLKEFREQFSLSKIFVDNYEINMKPN